MSIGGRVDRGCAILLNNKKEWKSTICSNMDKPRDSHAKRSQTEGRYHISLTCEIEKNDTNKLIYKTEVDSETQETNAWSPEEDAEQG